MVAHEDRVRVEKNQQHHISLKILQTKMIFISLHSRYNPENLQTLERYVDMQARENQYDVEANLAVLKLLVDLFHVPSQVTLNPDQIEMRISSV